MNAWGRKVVGELKKLKGQSSENKVGNWVVTGDTAEENRQGPNEAVICRSH